MSLKLIPEKKPIQTCWVDKRPIMHHNPPESLVMQVSPSVGWDAPGNAENLPALGLASHHDHNFTSAQLIFLWKLPAVSLQGRRVKPKAAGIRKVPNIDYDRRARKRLRKILALERPTMFNPCEGT